jgi:hypothetical protein
MKTRYAVLCKLPDDKRGEYSEEIDIIADERTSVTAIKRAAQNIIDKDYDPELRPVRVITTGFVTVHSYDA